MLENKHILLGVTGGIAAYKSAELVRLLKKSGADVRVILTKGGSQFITPLTLQALSGNKVHESIFDQETELQMSHIDLARWADLVVIAPASADIIAKLAGGLADNLLTTVCLASSAPVHVVPAMNQQMWQHPATQQNITKLSELGYELMGPASGEQACGETGPGRMLDPEEILAELAVSFPKKKLIDKRVLITAGPTREPIDPVRFLTNHSSGKMGFAMAKAAAKHGAKVTLITGPSALLIHPDITRIDVQTASQMHQKVLENIDNCDIFISAAAVADYQPANPQKQKIKKTGGMLELELERTRDIIAEIGQRKNKPMIVGFAAETDNVIENAKKKHAAKKMDMIVANCVSDKTIGFCSDDNEVTVITTDKTDNLGKRSKTLLAMDIMNRVGDYYEEKHFHE